MPALTHRIIGLFTETPLHAGSGSKDDIIDLPIQREVQYYYWSPHVLPLFGPNLPRKCNKGPRIIFPFPPEPGLEVGALGVSGGDDEPFQSEEQGRRIEYPSGNK